MSRQFHTRIVNPEYLNEWRFIIPSYQRPFVWQEEQINRLLLDFHQAYLRGDDQYYIGTVLTSEHPEHMYELIDGQQRITVLWLLAMAFRLLGEDTQITSFLKREDELRIDFAIRKQLKGYLLSLMDRKKNDRHQYSDHEVEEDPYLVNVAKALTTITKKLETLTFKDQKNLAGLGDYIFESVYMVFNTAPPLTNLNKLFATMNSAGVQLEQTDILKSKLLKAITTGGEQDERLLYDKIWTACAGMHNYFERNIRQLFAESDWRQLEVGHFSHYAPHLFKYKAEKGLSEEGRSHLLSEIIKRVSQENNSFGPSEISIKGNDEATIIYCRPIINFSQLLLHAYRIFLLEQGKEDFELPFHVKNLLEIFQPLLEEDAETVKGFFHCLWRVRYIFDKEVVKWVVDQDKEENLTLTTVNKYDRDGTRYFNRSPIETTESSLMLQSVRYFTGNYNTQIWLTPYLYRLLKQKDPIASLEDIDNRLSLLPDQEDKQTTWELMKNPDQSKRAFDIQNYLKSNHGTRFRHYWFQKLEYILWKNWDDKERDDKFAQFRITSKNSVEHVYPRNPEYGESLPDELMDSFGNLALLNVSQNSSYSHQDVKKKKTDFENKSSYDSLKLAKIYALIDYNADKPWQQPLIAQHQEEMIALVMQHYENL